MTDTANTLIVDTIGGDSVEALAGNDTTGSGGNDIVDLGAGNVLGAAGEYNAGLFTVVSATTPSVPALNSLAPSFLLTPVTTS